MILLLLEVLDEIGLVAVGHVLLVAVRRLLGMQKHLVEPDGIVLERDARVRERLERLHGLAQRDVHERVAVHVQDLIAASHAQVVGFGVALHSGHEYAVAFLPPALYAEHERLVAFRARQRHHPLLRLGRDGYAEHAKLFVHFLFAQLLLKAFEKIVELAVGLEVVEMVGDPFEHDAVDFLLDRIGRAPDIRHRLLAMVSVRRWRSSIQF